MANQELCGLADCADIRLSVDGDVLVLEIDKEEEVAPTKLRNEYASIEAFCEDFYKGIQRIFGENSQYVFFIKHIYQLQEQDDIVLVLGCEEVNKLEEIILNGRYNDVDNNFEYKDIAIKSDESVSGLIKIEIISRLDIINKWMRVNPLAFFHRWRHDFQA